MGFSDDAVEDLEGQVAAFGLIGVLDKAKSLGRPMGLVLMTGDSDHKMDVIAQRDGVVVRAKPFTREDLAGAIHRALAG